MTTLLCVLLVCAILKAFGTTTSKVDSTYNFAEVRAGDDIDIAHVSTSGQEPKVTATTLQTYPCRR